MRTETSQVRLMQAYPIPWDWVLDLIFLAAHKDNTPTGEMPHEHPIQSTSVLSAFSISDAHGANVSRRFTPGTACHGKPLP